MHIEQDLPTAHMHFPKVAGKVLHLRMVKPLHGLFLSESFVSWSIGYSTWIVGETDCDG